MEEDDACIDAFFCSNCFTPLGRRSCVDVFFLSKGFVANFFAVWSFFSCLGNFFIPLTCFFFCYFRPRFVSVESVR